MVIFWGPISWTVIFGLTFATFLTLVIVPVMYKITVNISKMINTRLLKIRKIESGSDRSWIFRRFPDSSAIRPRRFQAAEPGTKKRPSAVCGRPFFYCMIFQSYSDTISKGMSTCTSLCSFTVAE
jgi:hypothetical protein